MVDSEIQFIFESASSVLPIMGILNLGTLYFLVKKINFVCVGHFCALLKVVGILRILLIDWSNSLSKVSRENRTDCLI